jgi:hypothetical protein
MKMQLCGDGDGGRGGSERDDRRTTDGCFPRVAEDDRTLRMDCERKTGTAGRTHGWGGE